MTRTIEDLRELYGSLANPEAVEERLWTLARASDDRRRSRRRRSLLAAGAVAVVTASGVGTAAAQRWIPTSLGRLFQAPVSGAYNPDADTARVLTSGTTEDGQPLTLWYADANDDGFCLYALAGEAGTARPSMPPLAADDHPTDMAGGCTGTKSDVHLRTFGYQVFASSGDDHVMFIDRVPGASRATLSLADGTLLELPVADGWVAGAFSPSADDRPVLTGFDGSGNQIGQIVVPDGTR